MTSSFEEGADEANATVTRGHAHIRFDATVGDYRICDDCSEYGTRIFRDGRSIAGGQAEAASRKLGTVPGARSVGFKDLISLCPPPSASLTGRGFLSVIKKDRICMTRALQAVRSGLSRASACGNLLSYVIDLKHIRWLSRNHYVRLGNYVRLPVVSGHPEERRGSILGVLPRFWGCFSPIWVVFGVGAIGG
jgi:hypothetical protein